MLVQRIREVLDRGFISPKNLRMYALLIGIYQVMVSVVVLFLVLLGLCHAKEMDSILQMDQEKFRDSYITDVESLSINALRFRSASELASTTLMWMYTASAIASIYALSSLCLIFGITHNKSEFILPWLVVDMIGVLLTIDVMFYFSHGCAIIDFVGGSRNYWFYCGAILTFDLFTWLITHAYYSTMCRMKKLKECAMILIPFPATPGSGKSPYFQQRNGENQSILRGIHSA